MKPHNQRRSTSLSPIHQVKNTSRVTFYQSNVLIILKHSKPKFDFFALLHVLRFSLRRRRLQRVVCLRQNQNTKKCHVSGSKKEEVNKLSVLLDLLTSLAQKEKKNYFKQEKKGKTCKRLIPNFPTPSREAQVLFLD